jgi:uncharacterized membrane protein HdeD (DUF308 family)
VLLRAIAAVAFGVLIIAWPRHTALALVGLFGGYALFDGLTALLISARGGRAPTRFWLALAGAASIAAGVFAFARPRLLVLVLIGVIGAWLILRGLAEIITEISLTDEGGAALARGEKKRRWSVLLNGGMSAVFGAGLIAVPRAGALGFMWAVGAWAILHGAFMVPFALRLRRAPR